jgi:uncharacterized protein YhaN
VIRIARLDLERWGHFEGRSLRFGAAGALHVVYGPNEAGKSTTRRAVGALLFGVPERTADTFGRPGADLRVGALLELDGDASLEVVRRKGRKDTLLDAAGAPLDPALLDGALGGLTREVHQGLFEITHESLVAGGLELLAGRGAVGESLFAAAAGTSRLHGLMRRLEGEADALFSTRPSKKELNLLLARHADALRVLRDASLRPPRWEALSRDLAALELAYATAGEELEAAERERARLERLRGALPLAAQRTTYARELEALGEVPPLARDASSRREAATERRRAAGARLTAAERDLGRRRARRDELTVDEGLLPLAAEVESLHATASTVAADAARREERSAQVAALAPRVDQLLVSLTPALQGGAAPALDDDTRARLETCLQERAGVEQAARTAAEAVADARRAADRARASAAAQAAVPDDAPLAAALRAARAAGPVDDHGARARAQERSARAAAEQVAGRLVPAAGDAADLARLPIPDAATIDALRSALLDAERTAAGLETEATAIEERAAVLRRDRERAGADSPTLSESALATARGDRDAVWTAVRAALTTPVSAAEATRVATAHEQATAAADTIADTRVQRAEDVAHLAAVERELETLTRDAQELDHRRERHATVLIRAGEAWSTAWAATSAAGAQAFPAPAEAGAWLSGREAVLAQLAAAADAAAAATAAEALRDQHGRALRGALAATGAAPADDLPLATLAELAEGRLEALRDRAEQAARATEAVARTVAALEDAEAVAQRARARDEEWRERWAALRDGCGLAATLAPDDALAALRGLEQAVHDQHQLATLRAEVEAIDARRVAFERAVAELLGAVAAELAEQPPATAVAVLHRRAADARAAAAERDALQSALAELEAERAEAAAIIAEADDELAVLRAAAGAQDDAGLVGRERASARAEQLRAEIARLDGDLARAGGAPADEVAAAVAGLDADALPARVEELEAEAARRRDARDAAGEALTRARDELARLERSDEAAAARQEATSLEAQIQDVAERYARARLAQRILRDAIASFRSAHEGPLLARANALFPALTCERYARLETDLDERDRDILIAVTADGSRRRVEELSDGTREQLFLALRLAAIERHAATAQAVPVLFDDVLLESDDDRARRILTALADLATHTQVIVLTHHRHLVEIATAVLPADRLDVIALSADADVASDAAADAPSAAVRPRRAPAARRPAVAPTLAEELDTVLAGPPPSPFGEQTSFL